MRTLLLVAFAALASGCAPQQETRSDVGFKRGGGLLSSRFDETPAEPAAAQPSGPTVDGVSCSVFRSKYRMLPDDAGLKRQVAACDALEAR